MSGPIRPPLKISDVADGGSVTGRPINVIQVTDGTLTVSGTTATLDLSGSGGTPGGLTSEVQYNNAGSFAGDAGFFVVSAGGGDSTKVRIGGLNLQNNKISPRSGNDDVILKADGSGEIGLQSSAINGGTWTDSIVKIMCNTNADDAYLKFRSQYTSDDGGLMCDGNQDIILVSKVTNKDIDLQVNGTGQVEVQNTTTNNDTTFSVKGNGTGDSIINLNNASEAVSLICDTNKELKIQGGTDTFIFDVSSGTGGITFPDSTVQTTAASGVSFPLEAPNGSVGAPSYSFTNDTTTGMRFYTDFGNPVLSLVVDGARRLNMRDDGSLEINDAYKLPTAVTSTNDYVLTAQTDGSTAWAVVAESLTLSTLQSEVAASTDFADFQSRIAAL